MELLSSKMLHSDIIMHNISSYSAMIFCNNIDMQIMNWDLKSSYKTDYQNQMSNTVRKTFFDMQTTTSQI